MGTIGPINEISSLISRSPLCFTADTPAKWTQTSSGLSESCPKIGDVPKSPFPTVAALVPSAGTIALQIELHSDAGAVGTRPLPTSARCVARDPSWEGRKPCKFFNPAGEWFRQTSDKTIGGHQMKFRPLHDRVVIERIDAEAKTAGGIIIPDTAQDKPQQGKVIAVGPGGRDESGKLIPIDVKVGDRILFGKWSRTEVKIDGVEYLIMKESDIMGVLVEAEAMKKAA